MYHATIPSHNPLTIAARDAKGFQHRVLLDDFMEAFEAGEFTIDGLTLGAIRALKQLYKAKGGRIPATKQRVSQTFRRAKIIEEMDRDAAMNIFA